MTRLLRIEAACEAALFGSRWLLAPFYLGLAVTLALLLCRFAVATADLAMHGVWGNEEHLIVGILTLVDLSLVANLVLTVMLAGYENFVSRLDLHQHPDRPNWMAKIGFGEIKLKLMTSIVAISAIHLLEDFMNVSSLTNRDIAWRAGLHLLFVVGGVMLALMDRISQDPAGEGH